MKVIPLTKGQYTMVDDDDFDRFGHLKWSAMFMPDIGSFYAQRASKKGSGRKHTLLLHREIFDDPVGFKIDHFDHDTLNNQKSNLRKCTNAENARNRLGPQVNSRSGVRGVCWNKNAKKWYSQIKVDGRNVYLGIFSDIDAAASAYADANKKYFGAFGGKYK